MVEQQLGVCRAEASRFAWIAAGAVVLSLVAVAPAFGRTQGERHRLTSLLTSRQITTLVLQRQHIGTDSRIRSHKNSPPWESRPVT